jgi:hypothetical protein
MAPADVGLSRLMDNLESDEEFLNAFVSPGAS